MKKLLLLAVTASALAFTCRDAGASGSAVGNLALNVSGKAAFQGSDSIKGTQHIISITTKPFTEADVYSLITKAMSNAVVNFSAVPVQTLPADGRILYNPTYQTNIYATTIYDTTYTNITGLFYVTNNSGFYCPLSGRDTNGNYYSFLELNTVDTRLGKQGFGYPFQTVTSQNLKLTTSEGSVTTTETASLYVHDNPYINDESDLPGLFFFNTLNAIEIRGVLQLSYKIKGGKVAVSGTLTGTGNIVLNNGATRGVITSGRATFTSAP